MKQNRLDTVTDLLKARVNRAIGEARKQFKNTNPYRQEPKSTEERLYEFSEMTPEIEQTLRQQVGDMAVDTYIQRMQKLGGKYG